jgi:hypothetical protein
MRRIATESDNCQGPENKEHAAAPSIGRGINNLPTTIPSEHFLSREEELVKLTSAMENQERKHLVDVAITGMPGIGKTLLVHKFITENISKFHNVIWFTANSDIQSQFIKLAKAMNIVHDKFNVSKDTNMLLIVSEIYNKLSSSNTLIVFDNVLTDILKYLPPVHKNRNNILVIVTSSFKEWQCNLHLPLQCFPIEISEQFLVQNIENCSVENAQKLANNFDHLPLALQNLVAYFKHKQKISSLEKNTFSVDDLIHETILTEEFRCKYAPQLFYKFVPYSLLKDTVALESICSSVIQRISKNSFGIFSVRLLKLMSCLERNKITLHFFEDLKDVENKNITPKALLSLSNFSMISISENNISILPVIQNAIRSQYKDENLLRDVLLHMQSKMKDGDDKLPCVSYCDSDPHLMKIFNENYHDIVILKEFYLLFMTGSTNGKCRDILVPMSRVYEIITTHLKDIDLLKVHCIYLDTLYNISDKGFANTTDVLEACNKVIDEITLEKMKDNFYGLNILHYKCLILDKLNIELQEIWDISQLRFKNMYAKHKNARESMFSLVLLCKVGVKLNTIEQIQKCKEEISYACFNVFDWKDMDFFDEKMKAIGIIVDYYLETKLEDVAFDFITKLKINVEIKYKEQELLDPKLNKTEAKCVITYLEFKTSQCLLGLHEIKQAWDLLNESVLDDANYIPNNIPEILITLASIASEMNEEFKIEVVKKCVSKMIDIISEYSEFLYVDKTIKAIHILQKELIKLEMNLEILSLYDTLEHSLIDYNADHKPEKVVLSRVQIYKLLYMCENTDDLLEISEILAEICKLLDLEIPISTNTLNLDTNSINKVTLTESVKKVEIIIMEMWEKENVLIPME